MREIDVRHAPGVGQRPVDVEAMHVATGDEDLAQAAGGALLLDQRALQVLLSQRALRHEEVAQLERLRRRPEPRAQVRHAVRGACAFRPDGALTAGIFARSGEHFHTYRLPRARC